MCLLLCVQPQEAALLRQQLSDASALAAEAEAARDAAQAEAADTQQRLEECEAELTDAQAQLDEAQEARRRAEAAAAQSAAAAAAATAAVATLSATSAVSPDGPLLCCCCAKLLSNTQSAWTPLVVNLNLSQVASRCKSWLSLLLCLRCFEYIANNIYTRELRIQSGPGF